MTARACHDWSLLGYGSDPIPGDPDAVEAAAKSYASTSDTILQVSDYLANLDGSGQQSKTITALKARSRELSGQLQNVSTRYSETAAALRYYAPELRAAQEIADAAFAQGEPAERERKEAAQNAWNLWSGWKVTLEPSQAKQFEDSYYLAKHQAENAKHNVDAAKTKIQEAIRRRDDAANAAKSMISTAINNSPVTDSLLDKFKEVFDKGVEILTNVGKWIYDNIDTISLVLTIAATVVAFIPGLNVIAPALFFLSKVATVISKVKSVITVVKSIVTAVKTGDFSGLVASGAAALAGMAVGKLGGAIAGKLASGAKSLAGHAVYAFNSKTATGAAGAFSRLIKGGAKAGLAATEEASKVIGTKATKKVSHVLTEIAKGEISRETKGHITDYVGDKVEDYFKEKITDPVKHVVKEAVYERVDHTMDSLRTKTVTCGGAL